MEPPFLSEDAKQEFLEEAAIAASSTRHHDGGAVIVPFARTVLAAPATKPSSPVILNAPPGVPIPDYARRVIAALVTLSAQDKNLPLAPEEANAVVSDVLAALDLADLYRLSMGDPATAHKAGNSIDDTLDVVAVRRVAVLVLQAENKDDAHDPAVLAIVTAIVKDIALAKTSGNIIWPEPGAAVASYYRKTPRQPTAVPAEASHGG